MKAPYHMSSPHLIDYRCKCGKLLFKGLLFSSVVEVKCKRCGTFTTWAPDERKPWAMVESDASGRIVCASGDVALVFGRPEKELLGQEVAGILPLPFVIPESQDAKPSSYELHSTNLALSDGESRNIRSCILARMNDGKFAGYRIFSVPVREG